MQTFMVFFRENLPLRQLKVLLTNEGYENIRLDHSGNSLVVDTEQDSRELTTKLNHLIEDMTDSSSGVVVRSRQRLERLLADHLKHDNHCPANRIRYLLFQTTPSPARIDEVRSELSLDTSRLQFGQEGGYLCLKPEADRVKGLIEELEETLNSPILMRSHEAMERAVEKLREHERQLETKLY